MKAKSLIIMFYTAAPEAVETCTLFKVMEYCFNTRENIHHSPAGRARDAYRSGARISPSTQNDQDWLDAALRRYHREVEVGSKSLSGKQTREVGGYRERVRAKVISAEGEPFSKEIQASVRRHTTAASNSYIEVNTAEDWKKVAVEMASLLKGRGYDVSIMETTDVMSGKTSAIVKIVK